MVGVEGGVWSMENGTRLGDIVVSQPTGIHGGVVQWNFGNVGRNGDCYRTGSLDKLPLVLLHVLQELKTFDIMDDVDIQGCLSLMVYNKPRMGQTYVYQGVYQDRLFEATYDHKGGNTCNRCALNSIVQRLLRNNSAL